MGVLREGVEGGRGVEPAPPRPAAVGELARTVDALRAAGVLERPLLRPAAGPAVVEDAAAAGRALGVETVLVGTAEGATVAGGGGGVVAAEAPAAGGAFAGPPVPPAGALGLVPAPALAADPVRGVRLAMVQVGGNRGGGGGAGT